MNKHLLTLFFLISFPALSFAQSTQINYPPTDTTFRGSMGAGYQSLNYQGSLATAAYSNTAFGYLTLSSVSLGTQAKQNTAVGYQSLQATTTAQNNTAIGFDALKAQTTGGNSVGIGANADQANATGGNNVLIGSQAHTSGNGANNTVGIGYGVLSATTGSSNTAVGQAAGGTIVAGVGNTCIGKGACDATLTSGSYNIVIGYGIDTVASGSSNTGNIGNVIFLTGVGTSGSTPVGSAGIGTTSPISALAINGVTTYYGTAPTCGTGCSSITSGSTNTRGSMVSGSSVSAVTLTFASSGTGIWSTTPFCTISDSNSTAVADISAISTSALTVSLASALTSVTIYWHCDQ